MSILAKHQIKDKLPSVEKIFEKTRFYCKFCNKEYPEITGAISCPCNKNKWNNPRIYSKTKRKEWLRFLGKETEEKKKIDYSKITPPKTIYKQVRDSLKTHFKAHRTKKK